MKALHLEMTPERRERMKKVAEEMLQVLNKADGFGEQAAIIMMFSEAWEISNNVKLRAMLGFKDN